MIDGVVGDRARLSGAGRKHHDLRRILVARNRQHPLPVRRERLGGAVAEAHGGVAIGVADVDAVDRAARFARLGEDDSLAVGGEIADDGVVEPGEIARMRIAGDVADDAGAHQIARDERSSVRGDVVQRQRAGRGGHDALASAQRDRAKVARGLFLFRREPDLVAIRPPGHSLHALRFAAERPPRAGRDGDHDDNAAIVIDERMIEERDRVAARTEPRRADPADGVVENLADRKLETAAPGDGVHDGQAPIRRPVGFLDVVEDLARRAAGDRNLRQRPAVSNVPDRMAI